MRRLAGAVLFALVTVSCSSGDDETTARSSDGTASSEPPTTTSTTVPVERALWGDEPCTRTVSATGVQPAATPFQLQDLERMVLSRDDVGGLAGFESDIGRHGYWGNSELTSLEVNPPSTCEDLKELGRITGFANAYTKWSEPMRLVTFSVHLFWTEADALEWVGAFTDGITSSAGTDLGPGRFDVTPAPALGEGAVQAEHEGPDGVRSWVMFVRGPIVGWVTDLHTGPPNIDVVGAATTMAARVDQVVGDVATRSAGGVDAVALLSSPLPLTDYGERYKDLSWDAFFGGCADNEERGYIVGEEAANRSRDFGRIVGCTVMYDPAPDAPSSIVRIFSSLQVYKNAGGATDDMNDSAVRLERDGATRFDAGALGDEAIALVVPPSGEANFTTTRVTVRVGDLLASVAIQDEEPRDATAEVAALARRLLERIERLTP